MHPPCLFLHVDELVVVRALERSKQLRTLAGWRENQHQEKVHGPLSHDLLRVQALDSLLSALQASRALEQRDRAVQVFLHYLEASAKVFFQGNGSLYDTLLELLAVIGSRSTQAFLRVVHFLQLKPGYLGLGGEVDVTVRV